MRFFTRLLVLLLVGVMALAVLSPVSADDDDRYRLRGSFVGNGADFIGSIRGLGPFTGVAGPPGPEDPEGTIATAVWTFVDDDDDGDDDDDEDDDDSDTLWNRTVAFVIDFESGPTNGRFAYTQEIEFTGGTGDFEDARGRARIRGTLELDFTTGAIGDYDGRIRGWLVDDDD